jgi:hypothetical protein
MYFLRNNTVFLPDLADSFERTDKGSFGLTAETQNSQRIWFFFSGGERPPEEKPSRPLQAKACVALCVLCDFAVNTLLLTAALMVVAASPAHHRVQPKQRSLEHPLVQAIDLAPAVWVLPSGLWELLPALCPSNGW